MAITHETAALYFLKLDDVQSAVVSDALDVSGRLAVGELAAALDHPEIARRMGRDGSAAARDALIFLSDVLFGHSRPADGADREFSTKSGLLAQRLAEGGGELEISAPDAAVLCAALELHSRIGIGHLANILEHPRVGAHLLRSDIGWDAAEAPLNRAKLLLFGFPPNASHGIHSPDVLDCARVAWDIRKVILHRLSWDRAGNPPTRDMREMFSNAYDTPSKASCQPLPQFNAVPAPGSSPAP